MTSLICSLLVRENGGEGEEEEEEKEEEEGSPHPVEVTKDLFQKRKIDATLCFREGRLLS